jgi:hypothetical protein
MTVRKAIDAAILLAVTITAWSLTGCQEEPKGPNANPPAATGEAPAPDAAPSTENNDPSPPPASIRTAGSWYVTLKMALPPAAAGRPGWKWDEETKAELRCFVPGERTKPFIEVDFASPPGRSRVSEFGSIQLGRIGKGLKDFKILQRKTVKIGGHEALRAVYTYTAGDNSIKARGYFFLPKATGLVVRCEAPAEDYEIYAPVFEKALAGLDWQ